MCFEALDEVFLFLSDTPLFGLGSFILLEKTTVLSLCHLLRSQHFFLLGTKGIGWGDFGFRSRFFDNVDKIWGVFEQNS